MNQRGLSIAPEPDSSLPYIDQPEGPSTIIYDVFLSYASDDSEPAMQIYDSIISAGGKAFLSVKSLRAGDDFAEEIRKALNASAEVWLLLTPASLQSEWVITERGAAWALGKRIVPILLSCAPVDVPDLVRKLHYVDFSKYPELIKDRFPHIIGDPTTE